MIIIDESIGGWPMESWLQILVAVFSSVLASSGLWAFIVKRVEKKDVKTQMLVGLGHDRIMSLGLTYIERGWINHDEYENLYHYLYQPYEKLGGNGSAKRIMQDVDKLPIRNNYEQIEKTLH